jgi:tRNA A37 threonylcarbamoyltransferase TsaD
MSIPLYVTSKDLINVNVVTGPGLSSKLALPAAVARTLSTETVRRLMAKERSTGTVKEAVVVQRSP